MTSATRSFCPLDCGWHHDQPGPNWGSSSGAYPTTDIACPEGVDPVVFGLLAVQLQVVETAIREHLETHELIEWVQAIARLKGERDRLRTGMEDLFTRWFLNAHAGLGFRDAMMGIATDLRAVLDGPKDEAQTTLDNPLTSTNTVDNPKETQS